MRLLIAILISAASATLVHLTSARAIAHEFAAGELTIDHPIVSPPPNGVNLTAGYMTIVNAGDEPDRLVSAVSPGAERIEIHEVRETASGAHGMRPLPDGLVIPAGGRVALAPGGYHLMVIGLRQTLREGDTLPITLTFERAGRVNVIANVERPNLSGHGSHGGDGAHSH